MSHCIILLMKPIWSLQGPKHEPNNHKGTSNEILGTVNLKLLHLEDMGSIELVAVKTALRKSANHFKNVTGRDRQFLVSVKKIHDVAHPGHICLEVGAGLIQLLKWIIQDEMELGSVAHLLPHEHLCNNCKLGLVPRNHILGATSIEGLDQLMVLEMVLYEIDQTGEKEQVASYKL